MTKPTNKNKSWMAGLITALAASLCCITPMLAFVGGASNISSLFSRIEPYRPYLIGLTAAVFAWAWYQKLRPNTQKDCRCDNENKKSFRQSTTFLAIVTALAALLITFPYYAKILYPHTKEKNLKILESRNIQTAEFKIRGMTCGACAEHINYALSKTQGVIQYFTSYENGNSCVKFDKTKTHIDSIASVINKTGYKVISQNIFDK